MFGLSMTEIVIIAVLALLLIGPKDLPNIAKTLGKTLRDVRRASDDLKDTFQHEVRELMDDRPASQRGPPPGAVASGTQGSGALPGGPGAGPGPQKAPEPDGSGFDSVPAPAEIAAAPGAPAPVGPPPVGPPPAPGAGPAAPAPAIGPTASTAPAAPANAAEKGGA